MTHLNNSCRVVSEMVYPQLPSSGGYESFLVPFPTHRWLPRSGETITGHESCTNSAEQKHWFVVSNYEVEAASQLTGQGPRCWLLLGWSLTTCSLCMCVCLCLCVRVCMQSSTSLTTNGSHLSNHQDVGSMTTPVMFFPASLPRKQKMNFKFSISVKRSQKLPLS